MNSNVFRASTMFLALGFILIAPLRGADASQSERQFLSGRGPADAVPWEFTISGGRRAGEKTRIPVPSNWELQGFGTYNYGQEANKADEHGHYRLAFNSAAAWKGRRMWLVFDGVMTDATVTLNGKVAGPVHQGGFYRFRYDVTSVLKFGAGPENQNILEVDVAKVSANAETERAERGGDYWVFGGIFRPVWLEAQPVRAIDHLAIDARADGAITADVTLNSLPGGRPDGLTLVPEILEAQIIGADGRPVGAALTQKIPAGGTGRLRMTGRLESPRTWNSETPNLYTLRVALRRGDERLHVVDQRFGFRTFEVREGQGLFLNGQRILLKGVNRHSFRPETGRALNREDCYADARLIREMNMNAVRMSHYPPDEAFLEACDELGLYVLDEISGWQRAHGTVVGRLLVRELVERDVNHPSILFWDNGNEGGFNRDLDGEFSLYDPQQRHVLHPWDTFGGVDTKHYVSFDDFAKRLQGPNLVMPTEILHGLYDGGGGAGLDDYWRALTASPVGGGLFIWDFADEGVVRTDQNKRVDVFSTFGPDGIVGPHFEKEGSYYAVRDIWSPVQIDAPVLDGNFDGSLTVHNRYDFTSLAQCKFAWKWIKFNAPENSATPGGDNARYQATLAEGNAPAPAVAAHGDGKLALGLPANWRDADGLSITAIDPGGAELWTSTWPTAKLKTEFPWRRDAPVASAQRDAIAASPKFESAGNEIRLRAGDFVASFDAATGGLREVRRGEKKFALANGPRLAFVRPPSAAAKVEWIPEIETYAAALTRHAIAPAIANTVEIEVDNLRGAPAWAGYKLEISPDGAKWKTLFDSTRRQQDGTRFEFSPQTIAAVRMSNLRRYDGQPPVVKTFRIGYTPSRFPAATPQEATVTHGQGRDAKTGESVAWVETRGGASGLERARWTMHGDGSLQLIYSYTLDGEFAYHGVTFDHAEAEMRTLRWLGAGPNRVWQNRTRGTWLGIHEMARAEQQPGESWTYPEFEGYFGGLRWAQLGSATGTLTFASASPDVYLRVGTPRISHASTTVDFPAGDISFVHAIPAIGSKGKPAEQAGPASQWAKASGRYEGTLVLRLGD